MIKVEIDIRPPKDSINRGFYGIRLYPETNEEFGAIEHILEFATLAEFEPINFAHGRHYLVLFKEKKE